MSASRKITCQTGKERVDYNDAIDLIRWVGGKASNMSD